MALPYGTTGSLTPAFAPARPVGLAVKLPCAFALYAWFPIRLREPSHASVTIEEATAPVKLPTRQCPPPRLWAQVRIPDHPGWYFNGDSIEPRGPTSKSPTYPTPNDSKLTAKLQ